jgi:small-conductance mechanosensitive channel
MTNIINLSFHTSIATITFHLPYSVSVDEVDRILTEQFRDFSKRHPEVVRDPAFLGIREFASDMVCQVACEVPEVKRNRIERILAREIKNTLDANNIPMGYVRQ